MLFTQSAEVLSTLDNPFNKIAEPVLEEATPEEVEEAAVNDRPAMRAVQEPVSSIKPAPSFDLPDLPGAASEQQTQDSPAEQDVLEPRRDAEQPAGAEAEGAADEVVVLPPGAEHTLNLFMFYRWGAC